MTDPEKELVDLLKGKLVMPFIGAGFSMTCGFPSWKQLIEHLLERFKIDPSDIKDKSDFLRIAEYLKILNGGEIGPIRLEIQKVFNEQMVDISQSEPHLHLVSLDAPIIYTTNYDNLIENTFQYLKIPYTQVVTTRDIVKAANSNFTQIVKFHGSFEHEETMVLTESDYLTRLEFGTSIDIKLRADVLGKSILFVGYSFTDFNIRYLWFKLRKMMKGVRDREIPKSFILLAESDRMMETLFQNIGIFPIHLTKYKGSTLTEKLCEFLECLIVAVNERAEWAFEIPVIATNVQIDKLEDATQKGDERIALRYLWLLNNSRFGEKQIEYLTYGKRKITDQEMGLWFSLIERTTSKLRRPLIKLLLKLEREYDLRCFYNILIIAFLRYREARDEEDASKLLNIKMLFSQEKLSSKSEFQMLFDALGWTKFSKDLKKDTTLYFLLLIASYFTHRMDEKILAPGCLDDTDDWIELPSEYYNISPQKVIQYIKKAAPWTPDIDFLIENSDNFDRICESCGCTLQMEGEFEWNVLCGRTDVLRIFSE